jgi:AcrR family transcriptional regulator
MPQSLQPRRRAQPLPADERRLALITATLPLIREHGAGVSTRQIAQACGVAEGTIFRVFPDKDSLIRQAVEAAFDPAPLVAKIRGVDPSLPLDERLVAVVDIMQERLVGVFDLMGALNMRRPPHAEPAQRGQPGVEGWPMPRRPSDDVVHAAIAKVIAPDREQLRMPSMKLARALRLLVFAATHPGITDGHPLSAQEIVALVLDGARMHDERSSTRGRRPC